MGLFRRGGETIATLAITAAVFPLGVFGQEPTAEFIEQTAARAMEVFNTPSMAINRMMGRLKCRTDARDEICNQGTGRG